MKLPAAAAVAERAATAFGMLPGPNQISANQVMIHGDHTSMGSRLGERAGGTAFGGTAFGKTGFGAFAALGVEEKGEPAGILRSQGTSSGLARQGSAALGRCTRAQDGGLPRSMDNVHAHGKRPWDAASAEHLNTAKDFRGIPGIGKNVEGHAGHPLRDPLGVPEAACEVSLFDELGRRMSSSSFASTTSTDSAMMVPFQLPAPRGSGFSVECNAAAGRSSLS